MELEQDYNFNDPVEVTEIFRVRQDEKGPIEEFGSRSAFCWEDVTLIKNYAYPDDWRSYPGPKYYVKLRSYPESILVLGEYESMLLYWMMFRNMYPIYLPGEEDGMDNREN